MDEIFAHADVNAEERKLLANIKESEDKTLPLIEQISIDREAGRTQEAHQLLMMKAKPTFIDWLASINKFIDYQERLNHLAATEAREIAGGFQKLMIVLTTVGLLASGILGYLIINSIVRPLLAVTAKLDSSTNQISSVSEVISSSSQSLAEGSSRQAASIEEISASVEELSSMTKRNAESAELCKKAANEARYAAESGASEMMNMQSAMSSIQQSSVEVSAIMNTIDEIAFQTNLLSLNAAVEAARAGSAGAGFAVVANEVRNLAQRSALAAKETAAKMQTALERSAQGVELSQKVMLGLQQIVEKNRQVDSIITEVAVASREQSEGLTQINSAIGEMDKVTQINAASASETANTLLSLNSQSTELRSAASQLSELVGVKKIA